MATKVFPAVRPVTEEDVDKENVSTARTLGAEQDERLDELQTRLGRLIGRLASMATLPPERAANIFERVKNAVRK